METLTRSIPTKPITRSLFLVLLLAVILIRAQSAPTLQFLADGESNYELRCVDDQDSSRNNLELPDECSIIKFFNETQVDEMEAHELDRLSRHCACQLASLWTKVWEKDFDDDPLMRRVSTMVKRTILKENATRVKHPDYLWSDIDVTVYKISIYTSTKDYFEQQAHNKSMVLEPAVRQRLERDEVWRMIRRVCHKIAKDPVKLFRYLENLNRMNPVIFFRLVMMTDPIEIVYQASKACKLLLMMRLNDYKLKPDNEMFVAADAPKTLQHQLESSNSITNDIDLMLKDASVQLLNCSHWQRHKSSIQELLSECPIMMGELMPTNWASQNPSLIERSQTAIKCGCQLLLHNSTWQTMIENSNIQIMSKALTNYLNRMGVPNFSEMPIWAIHGWFENSMARFRNNRKATIKEVVKVRQDNPDPLIAINESTKDFSDSLELIRRACNFIVFNYNKGSKEQANELKLIKFLDNLQLLSQDQLFVFHLTLRDPNLFKLHALSKMCEPFVK